MRHVVIGTAGHIDHGKSTLVRALTGIDPDRLKEEKARGITIDLGFAHDVRGDVTLAFVDVPGHERFVKNMLAGASGIDVMLLVVAADESVMPQTREHFDICRLLRVPVGVVALTKADLVDAETLELATMDVRELVAGSFLDGAAVVPVSATTGQGLDALRSALLAATQRPGSRPRHGAFRLPIDRVFSVKGFGTVVTGTVISGHAAVEDELELLPSGLRVKIRGIQGHGMSVRTVGPGQRAAINLAAVDVEGVTRGDSLVTPGTLRPTRRLDASVEVLGSARPIKHGARVRFHHGTGEVLGRVSISQLAGAAPGTVAPSDIPAARRAHARIRLEAPVVLTRGDRFILRAYSPPVTIGGGLVLDPHPPRGPIRTSVGRARFDVLDAGAGDEFDDVAVSDRIVESFVAERGRQGLDRSELVARAGLAPVDADAAERRLTSRGRIVALGALLVRPEVIESLGGALTRLLTEYHRSEPLSQGLPREEARERLFARAHPAVFDAVLQALASRGAVVGRDRLALATHEVRLSGEESQAREHIEQAFRAAGLRPPDVAALPQALGLAPTAVERALTLLQRQRVIVKVDTLWFHADALESLKNDVRALKGTAGAKVDVAAFKERYGVTRKFAIPLLEFLDRERVTRRVGETRVVL